MTSATVIVFEKQPRWTPELQRQFDDDDIRVRGCTSTADVTRAIASHTSPLVIGDIGHSIASSANAAAPRRDRLVGTLVLLDLTSGLAECLQLLGRSLKVCDFPPTVVIGNQELADLEWPVRELGAIDFLLGHLSGDELATICRRQLTSTQPRHA